MDPQDFNVQYIIDGQGVDIAITGMVIVFCVLALITTFITYLPKVLLVVAKKFPETEVPEVSPPSSNGDETEILAAIGYVLHSRFQGRG